MAKPYRGSHNPPNRSRQQRPTDVGGRPRQDGATVGQPRPDRVPYAELEAALAETNDRYLLAQNEIRLLRDDLTSKGVAFRNVLDRIVQVITTQEIFPYIAPQLAPLFQPQPVPVPQQTPQTPPPEPVAQSAPAPSVSEAQVVAETMEQRRARYLAGVPKEDLDPDLVNREVI